MITSRLFRKHFAIAFATVLAFIGLGSLVSVVVTQRMVGEHHTELVLMFAHVVEEHGDGDPLHGLAELEHMQAHRTAPFRRTPPRQWEAPGLQVPPPPSQRRGPGVFHFYVLGPDGKSMSGPGEEVPAGDLPAAIHEIVRLDPLFGSKSRRSVVRLDFPEPRYLLVAQDHPSRPPALFPFTVMIQMLMVLLGMIVGLWLIYRSLREHMRSADIVISDLQRGNLKARFPVRSNDEIGQAMERFNKMADEIERLVERVRAAEKSRNFLLQELAHDLRTPVASIRNLLDIVFGNSTMSTEVRELADLAVQEVDYINRLLEDLLFLALVNEPHYRPNQQPLDLVALIKAESENIAILHKDIHLDFSAAASGERILGDEHLLRRLVRNALDNAFSFARSKVLVSVAAANGKGLIVRIEDDGPGFPKDSLEHFGERQVQRTLVKTKEGKLSLGLGSVIIKTVVSLHRGTLVVSNGASGGARLEFVLPLEKLPQS